MYVHSVSGYTLAVSYYAAGNSCKEGFQNCGGCHGNIINPQHTWAARGVTVVCLSVCESL